MFDLSRKMRLCWFYRSNVVASREVSEPQKKQSPLHCCKGFVLYGAAPGVERRFKVLCLKDLILSIVSLYP